MSAGVCAEVRHKPADAAQLAAWQLLWERLLAQDTPENGNAPSCDPGAEMTKPREP